MKSEDSSPYCKGKVVQGAERGSEAAPTSASALLCFASSNNDVLGGTFPTWVCCRWKMMMRVPIMRQSHCWTVLQVSILAGLLLTLNADSGNSSCDVQLYVRRGTVYEASLGKDLRINCTVAFCNNSPPTVSWWKNYVPVNVSSSSHIKTELKIKDNSEGISFLIFKNILSNDSGLYHCRGGGGVSHKLNVSVHDDGEHSNDKPKNDTSDTSTVLDPKPEDLWMYYVCFAVAIVLLVIIVILISVVSMRGCKGKPKKETNTENQYAAIPMVEQPFPRAGLQPSPTGSPSAPPRRKSRTNRPPSQPLEPPLPRDSEHLYGKVKEDRGRQRNPGEGEGSSIVYAALNHQLPARPVARPRRPTEETSEYAAIRV